MWLRPARAATVARMLCPACGEFIANDEEPADFIVCPSCFEGVALREGESHGIGTMSALQATNGPFYVGATGALGGRAFTVIGRVRYAWADGHWDEWYLAFLDGTHAWISEDGAEYSFEHLVPLEEPPAVAAGAEPGSRMVLEGHSYEVEERGVARFQGAEGKLPFAVVEGEVVPYLDLVSERGTATLEFDEEGATRFFRGRPLQLSQVDIDFRGAIAGALTSLDGGPRDAGTSNPVGRLGAKPDDRQQQPKKNEKKKKRPKVPFQIGQAGKLDGQMCTIAGHIQYREREEGRVYISDEFLLRSEDGRERWLLMERGHFALSTPLASGPPRVPFKFIQPTTRFDFMGRTWKAFERGKASISWVEGELPWVARVGDTHSFMDAVSPPHLLSAEWTTDEVEWFTARYLPRAEVAAAFQMKETRLPPKRGIAPNQPRPGAARASAWWVLAAAIFVNLMLAIVGLSDNGTLVERHELGAMDYSEGYLTEPFVITDAPALCLATFKAPAQNEWVYVDCALVDSDDKARVEFSAQVSYYSGREGGESWSEGSKEDEAVFRIDEPGAYRLLIKGAAGHGEYASIPGRGPRLSIELRENCGLARWHFLLAGLLALVVLGELGWASWFESRRWQHSDL